MNSERSTRESGHPSKNLQRLGLMLAAFLLAACGEDATSTAGGKGNGNLQASELTILRKAESETTPDVRKVDIASISCPEEGKTPRTRVEFEGGGFAQARVRMNEMWVIAVGLPELEFALRDLIMPSHTNPELVFDSSGNITGPRTFHTEVNSDDPVTYEIIFKIVC